MALSLPVDMPQPRQGHAVMFNPEGLASATVSEQVHRLGAGPYQLLVWLGVGCAALSESVEMGAAAPMHAALTRAFDLGDAERAALPAFTVAGSALGMLLAGPFCDRFGRKAVLVVSLVAIVVCMTCTALLPTSSGAHLVLSLRFLAGFAASLGVPAGTVLAVESSPHSMRARMLFGIAFLGSVGYLLCAVGLGIYMPDLGDSENDRWRAFYMFVAVPSAISLPIVLFLCESPCYLAVNRRPEECVEVLCQIARLNGMRLDPRRVRLPMPPEVATSEMSELRGKVMEIVAFNACMLILLSMVDFGRSYFVAGSAYVWKDFFEMASDKVRFSPASLNIVASLSPLFGLLIGERLLFVGVRHMVLLCSLIACGGLLLLTANKTVASTWYVLGIVILVKLTYGPMSTCVSLMKTEAFPTEIRATAFALISVVGKIGSAMGPTVIEALKGDGTSDSWADNRLNNFVYSLAVSVAFSGMLALAIPGQTGNQEALEDFVFGEEADGDFSPMASSPCRTLGYGTFAKKDFGTWNDRRLSGRAPSEGSIWDIWDSTRGDEDDAASVADSACSSVNEGREVNKAQLRNHSRTAWSSQGSLASGVPGTRSPTRSPTRHRGDAEVPHFRMSGVDSMGHSVTSLDQSFRSERGSPTKRGGGAYTVTFDMTVNDSRRSIEDNADTA